ncbi:MAG TPA: alpha/beta hydrolase [Steroidobacteraceae bacterium]|nr:alpha/beta hydrolase [Steroidobacteraceae bacterium]
MATQSAKPAPIVVLLHGVGATGAVWHGVAAELSHQAIEVLAPDLPGHGEAAAVAPYSVGALAAAVAAALPPGRPWCVAGHSLGAYVALALASGWFGAEPVAAVSLGAKLTFTESERARAAEMAARPARWFATRDEAVERYRRIVGLPASLVANEAFLERGVRSGLDGYRLAHDPAAFAIVVPPFRALLAAAVCPVLVVRGEHDPVVTRAECEELPAPFEELTGLGHNPHVEDPARTAALVARLLKATGR